MKRIICLISALALLMSALTACGDNNNGNGSRKRKKNKDGMVYEGDGGYVVAETRAAETRPKVRATDANGQPVAADGQYGGDGSAYGGDSYGGDGVSYDSDGNIIAGGTGTTTTGKETATNTTTTVVNSIAPVEEVYYLEGIVYKSEKNNIIVKDPDLGFVSAKFDSKAGADKIKVGDDVLITHSGDITQGELSEAKEAYTIEVMSKAMHDYKIQTFTCQNLDYNLKFSLLMPADWTSRNIEYPTEGDFTDWGVRIIPKGETTGLDISWHSAFAVSEPYDITPIKVNGMDANRYSKKGNWHFYVYDSNSFIAANGFYGTTSYDTYKKDMEFILETLMFDEVKFLK